MEVEGAGKCTDISTDELINTVIWNNKFICINGMSVYNKRLANKGIIKLQNKD